jgi:small subunit ribosomal protein S9
MSQPPSFVATGRRKTATARVRLVAGTGVIKINGRAMDEYFPTEPLQHTVMKPLEVANVVKTYDISVNATGGGINGQAGAIRMAVSRALLLADDTIRPALKIEGLLTRDPRMKERKKSGQPGARKRFQFSKR